MEPITQKLSDMYAPKWEELKQALGERINLIGPPLLLGVGLRPEEKDGMPYSDEAWYTDADLKVMIFGQENRAWGWPKDDETQEILTDSDDFIESYQDYWSSNYAKGESPYLKIKNSPFFTTGFNGMMYGINLRLHEKYPHKRAAFIWNDVSKLFDKEGTAVSDDLHKLEMEHFKVIPEEVNLLKPDVAIFFTGFSEKYNRYIKENFEFTQEPTRVSDVPMDDVVKLHLGNIPLAYKTHHPRSPRNGDGETRWKFYNAILDDINANLDKIVG